MNRDDVKVGDRVVVRPTQRHATVRRISPGGAVQVQLDARRLGAGGWYTTSADELEPEPMEGDIK